MSPLDPKIYQKLKKYIDNNCTESELQDVINYYQQITSSKDLPTVESILQLINEYPKLSVKAIDNNYKKLAVNINSRKKSLYQTLAIAASISILISVGYFYLFTNTHTKELPNTEQKNQITLTTQDGTTKIISKDSQIAIKNANGSVIGYQKGNQLVYNNTNEDSKELVYNELTIPFGEKFDLLLSDGTKVKLNSGSSVKYPVKFIKGQKREVFLTGEAFFDVAENKKDAFIVKSDNLNIKVYGTTFNVSSYQEDYEANVVLVEGSVSLCTDTYKENEIKITPGTKGTLHKNSKKITTKKVSTSIYTAWMQGDLVFRNMPFKNILKKLERHYDITIANNNKNIENEIFNASFRNESIDKVLSYFKESYAIEYTIKNDKLIYIN